MVAATTFTCILKLRPFLMIDSGDSGGHRGGDTLGFGIPRVDRDIRQRIREDPAGLADTIRWNGKHRGKPVRNIEYKFGTRYITLTWQQRKPTSTEEREELVYYIEENGPDTWMEGDIYLLDADDVALVNRKLGTDFGVVELDLEVVSFHCRSSSTTNKEQGKKKKKKKTQE